MLLGQPARALHDLPGRIDRFTASSRASLEYGFWTEDPALLEGMERFLLRLVAASEGLAGADEPVPQFRPVDYDDEAMREVMAETEWDEDAEGE